MFTKKQKCPSPLITYLTDLEIEGRSLWQDARIRFMRNKAAMVSLVHPHLPLRYCCDNCPYVKLNLLMTILIGTPYTSHHLRNIYSVPIV